MKMIDADLLRKKISNGELMDYDCVQNLVNELLCAVVLPLIDDMSKKEERHGHWLEERTPNGSSICSVCKREDHQSIWIYDYCPWCGSRMDEEVEE